MNLDDKQLKDAVYSVVAKQVLEGLSTEARDAILQKGISEAISDYSFRKAVEEVASAKAAEVAREIMSTDDWRTQIEMVIRAGIEDYLAGLRQAIPAALLECFHGEDGKYPKSGKVLGKWPKIEPSVNTK